MANWIDALQWAATVVTVAAGMLTSSSRAHVRRLGFCSFLLSNLLWIAWGWQDGAQALIALQLCLVVTNARGFLSNKGKI